MSSFAVEWTPEASAELARIWMQARDRRAVTAAQARIDRLLASDPRQHGHFRSEGLFRIDVPPLSCTYTVDDGGQRVEVTWLWYSP